MHFRAMALTASVVLMLAAPIASSSQQQAHTLQYGAGKSITLSLPSAFDINIAATGLKRVRFFAQSPDGRIFATGMHDLADNRMGSVFILDGWNDQTRTFGHVTHYLDHLRNPNSIAFWTDPETGQTWFYVALTDRLVRYAYHAGETAPAGPPQTLISFPDYGLNYKYGGWHLTRTIAVQQAGNSSRIFVSVGSSCNYCQEREVARASVISMDPDGGKPKVIAQGIRNAVDLRFVPDVDGGKLFATDMGDDHLGDKHPDDTFFEIDPAPAGAVNYGWPTCYFDAGKAVHDTTPLPSEDDPSLKAHLDAPPQGPHDSVYGVQKGVADAGTNLAAGGGHAHAKDPNADLGNPPAALSSCEGVPRPYSWFAAHSSPLGFQYFSNADPNLKGSFVAALHGAGHPRIGTGYKVVRFTGSDRKPVDFITGFLSLDHGRPVVHGRPCGIFRLGPDSFLLSDDYLGLVYYIHPAAR